MTTLKAKILTAATAIALVSACSTGSDKGGGGGGGLDGPGVDTDAKTITVSAIAITSGPAAALGTPITAGAKAYFDAVNADGGIDGWKIKYVEKDSGYEPQRHVQLFNEVKADSSVIVSHGSPTTKAIQGLADREGIPVAPASPDTAWGKDITLMPVGTPFAFDAANVLDHLSNAGEKDLRVGVIYQNDELGADGMRGYEAAVKEYGITEAGRETYKPGDTDFTAQIQALKAAKAETVMIIGVPSATGAIVGTAASLGFSPQWALISSAFVEQLMTKDGAQGSTPTPVAKALDGAIVTSLVAPWGDESVPGMKDMLAAVESTNPDQVPSVYFIYGYAQAKAIASVLAKAVESGDLSRDGVLEARKSIGTIDLGGLTPDVTYEGSASPPSRSTLIQKIDVGAVGFRTTLKAGVEGAAAKVFALD